MTPGWESCRISRPNIIIWDSDVERCIKEIYINIDRVSSGLNSKTWILKGSKVKIFQVVLRAHGEYDET